MTNTFKIKFKINTKKIETNNTFKKEKLKKDLKI